ncbi:hypothetical protein LZ24_00163 [Desulfobotulus alkaliphilus]|uniref:PF0610-like winged HTH N-terminal domain-containing protein n=1 Tax=Desulfobotulus alkaliphilus TaxID=622671 RepID=A0A562S9A7_9BACT|nr:transcriptional regulator [Desulfobotulus alkaliphilus]TWI77354.1 hypothetical protein LZ24_00163 [Desulfobotulus alkaliphilus]
METPRQKIRTLLLTQPHNLRDLSLELRLPEKEILKELPHVEKSLKPLKLKLRQIPARCQGCGYTFADRKRFSKPGKCPDCRETFIESAFFYIDPKGKTP